MGQEKELRCGISIGYPPYQYNDKLGNPAGIDYQVAKLVFKTAGKKIKFVQRDWASLLSSIFHNTGEIDLLCGAEINDERKKYLDFSEPFYNRHIVIFTLKNSPVYKVSDLYGKIITGDRDSFLEKHLGKRIEDIRVMKTTSKEESFQKLKNGSVVAVIAPREVGYYFARELKLKVRIIAGNDDPGSPVAFGVRKGNVELLKMINHSLHQLRNNGSIAKILDNAL